MTSQDHDPPEKTWPDGAERHPSTLDDQLADPPLRLPDPATRSEEPGACSPPENVGPGATHQSGETIIGHRHDTVSGTAPQPARVAPVSSVEESVERPHPLTPLVNAWILVVTAVFFISRELVDSNITSLSSLRGPTWIFLGIVTIQVVIGLFRWRYTRFVVGEDEFRIDHSFIWHSSDKINYAKIQSVDIQQPFAARLLRMAKLHIDVGSEAGKQIEFLSLKRAEQLREVLLLRARAPQSDTTLDSESATSASPVPGQLPVVEESAIFQTRPSHLILTALLSFDFLLLLITQIVLLVTGQLTGVWGPSVALMIPLIGMLWTRTTSQWNYRLTRHGTTIRSSRGLFTLASQQIPRQRVQGIRISQRLLHRTLGLWRVQMTVLGVGHQQDASERSNILLPAGKWSDVQATVAAIWPGLDLTSFEWQQQPPEARWLTWLTFRTRGWALGQDVVATRRGLFIHRTDLVPYARIQGLSLVQGPLQRQLGLAAIDVQLSTGVVHPQLGHLKRSSARELLFKLSALGEQARETDLVTTALLSFPPPAPDQFRG